MQKNISFTRGFPATWNDKTTVLYDQFTRGIHEGNILSNYKFELLEYDNEGNIITVKYRGVWIFSDNGYLTWSTTIPPYKQEDILTHRLLFSKWVESIRKDIECDFGILKGRFCSLKYGMRFQSVDTCDKLFKTLCALHNLLIKADGLDMNWLGYEEALDEYVTKRNQFPVMLLRLHSLYVEMENERRQVELRYQAPAWKREL